MIELSIGKMTMLHEPLHQLRGSIGDNLPADKVLRLATEECDEASVRIDDGDGDSEEVVRQGERK